MEFKFHSFLFLFSRLFFFVLLLLLLLFCCVHSLVFVPLAAVSFFVSFRFFFFISMFVTMDGFWLISPVSLLVIPVIFIVTCLLAWIRTPYQLENLLICTHQRISLFIRRAWESTRTHKQQQQRQQQPNKNRRDIGEKMWKYDRMPM